MANRKYRVYSDVDTRLTYNEEGSQLSNKNLPYIFSKESVDLELNYVKNWTDENNIIQYTGFAGSAISSSAVIDNDYNHINSGALVAGLSGSITSIEISGLTDIPLETGFIQLVNAAGQSETVAYTAVTFNDPNFVFTVSATLINTFLMSDVAGVSDPSLIKTINIDESQKDVGVFTITLDADSLPYLRQIANKASISGCQFEHQVKDSDPKLIFVSSFDFLCLNVRDDDGVIPPPADGDYYTKVESDASFVSRDSANVDIGTLLSNDDYFLVYNKDTGESERYKISDIALGTQVSPVQNVYIDTTAMLADQGSQSENYLQQADDQFFKKESASTGSLSNYTEVGAQDSPIEGLYSNTGDMILGQSNQTANYIQRAGASYYEYLGTTAGNISDYQLIGSGGGGGAVDDVFGRTGNVVAVSGDYTAEQISETAIAKILTNEERTAINLTNYTMTGVITGGEVTQNTSTTYNIAAGTGIILDYSDPANITKTFITWAQELNVSIPDIGQPLTLLFVVADNTIEKISRASIRTVEENRLKICLQVVIHNSGVQIDGFSLSHKPAFGGIDACLDYVDQNGVINTGNLYKANGANLRLDRDAGFSTIPFINISVNILDPVTKTDNAELAVLITPNYKDGIGGFVIGVPSLDIDTLVYDDGSGTLANIPNNQYVNHRMTYFPDGEVTAIQYGQVIYSTETAAINAIYKESFDLSPILSTGSLTTFITIKKGETDLTNAVFTENVASGSGGGSSSSGVITVNSGTDITVDNADPQNPIINFTGSSILSDGTTVVRSDGESLISGATTNSFSGTVDGTVDVLDNPAHNTIYRLYVNQTAQVRIENVSGDAIFPTVTKIDGTFEFKYDAVSSSYKVI